MIGTASAPAAMSTMLETIMKQQQQPLSCGATTSDSLAHLASSAFATYPCKSLSHSISRQSSIAGHLPGSLNQIPSAALTNTFSLTAALVQQASARPSLTHAPEAEEDAAAFAAQQIRPTATELLGDIKPVAAQWDENDLAELVIVAEPETATVGSLHPRGSLYEKPVNVDSAKAQHARFREVLSSHGAKVLTVREILAFNVDERLSARLELEALAANALTYQLSSSTDSSSLSEAELFYLSDEYKAEVVTAMSTSQLIEICMINPVITLTPSFRDTGFTASYSFEPLSNLVYTRDQQITTGKGVIMARLRSQQRQREVALMEYCFRKLGLNIAGSIVAPGYLEGGDFFPVASRDLSLVGIGLRSNMEACQQLMDQDLLGTNRLGVVRDDFDRNQDRMHLDCVFSILDDSCCIMLDTIIGATSPQRRLVDEYAKDPRTGKYVLIREGVEFSAFIKGEGYSIIPIQNEHQLAYACNVLNLGKGRIVCVHAPSGRQIMQHKAFRGDVQVIEFSSVTSMYGSVHCASQVVRRTAPATARPQHPSAARAAAAASAKAIKNAAAAAAPPAAASKPQVACDSDPRPSTPSLTRDGDSSIISPSSSGESSSRTTVPTASRRAHSGHLIASSLPPLVDLALSDRRISRPGSTTGK